MTDATGTNPVHELLGPRTDYYQVFADVTVEDLEWWRSAREFTAWARPYFNEGWETAEYQIPMIEEAGRRGLVRDGIDIEGQPAMSLRASRLISLELPRADASLAGAVGVQAGLCMQAIAQLGSEEQKEKYLGPMSRLELRCSFALTEPNHGSDSIALETSARREGDEWVINGEKKWIGHGSIGHIAIIWARDTEDGQIKGFIVDQNQEGYSAETIVGKASLRGLPQAHITLNDVRVSDDRRLPGANTFRDTAKILTGTRVTTAFWALGISIDSYEKALDYAQRRVQFGRPLVKNQIIQQRLADMQQELTSLFLYCRRLLDLEEAGTLTEQQAALGKVYGTRTARKITANARDMFGGVGILLENDVARHRADVEALHTFEGTDTMQSLIVGKDITGVSAYTS